MRHGLLDDDAFAERPNNQLDAGRCDHISSASIARRTYQLCRSAICPSKVCTNDELHEAGLNHSHCNLKRVPIVVGLVHRYH